LLDSTLLESLKKDSPGLRDLSRDFWGSYSDWDVVCFYENRDADYGPWKTRVCPYTSLLVHLPVNHIQVVSAQSASLYGKRMIFLDTDHSGLNKFSGRHDKNFALLLPEIQRMAKSGPSIVIDRHGRKDME
jgi:hypothetical protein